MPPRISPTRLISPPLLRYAEMMFAADITPPADISMLRCHDAATRRFAALRYAAATPKFPLPCRCRHAIRACRLFAMLMASPCYADII